MDIGKTMMLIRDSQGMTRKDMAGKIGITPGALWKIETGKTVAKQATIDRFLLVTGVSRSELYMRSICEEDLPCDKNLQMDMLDFLSAAIGILYRHRKYDRRTD